MQNKLIGIFIGILLVIGVGTLVYMTKKPATLPSTTSSIALEQISKHNTRTSCWSAVNGGVYDLTSWIPKHPGGEDKILSLCGVDGSAGYNGKHGDSSKPATVLGGFKIGVLVK